MPRFAQLPEPTWTRSDNDLLPKWLKYVEVHGRKYGSQSTDELRRLIENNKYWIQRYTEELESIGDGIKEVKAKLAIARAQADLTDDNLIGQYEKLVNSPYVTGTRIGEFGDLVVQFQPFDDSHAAGTLGTYELSYKSLRADSDPLFRFIGGPEAVLRAARWSWSTYEKQHSTDERYLSSMLCFGMFARQRYLANEWEAIMAADLLPTLEFFVGRVIKLMDGRRNAVDTDPAYLVGWSGLHVQDPASALRVTMELSGAESVASRVAKLESNLEAKMAHRKEYVDAIRKKRKEIRDAEAEIKQLEAASQDEAIDEEEARKTLAFITTIPGVVGFRFCDGIPVLHVRTSFVHEGRRYDLGDFEVYFTPHADAVKVNRTRPPAGRDYTSGWHGNDWFCFGSRAKEIQTQFRAGNFAQFANVTVGTLNTISNGHEYLVGEGHFAEIPMDAVPQRTLRNRPRRRGMRRPNAAA